MRHIPTYCRYCIQVFKHTTSYINIILERRKHISFRTTNSDFTKFCHRKDSIETFLKKNYENKK